MINLRRGPGRGAGPNPTIADKKGGVRMNGEKKQIEKADIQKLFKEVEAYRQALNDAEDALESAEADLDAALAAYYEVT